MSQIVNGIKGQVVTAGSQYALKKVSGILKGIVSPQPEPKDGIDEPEKQGRATNILQFPLDVTAAPGLGNQGHYVMFFINEQEDAEIQFGTRGNKNAFGDVFLIPSATCFIIFKFISNKSSLVIPGFLGTPAVIIITSEFFVSS